VKRGGPLWISGTNMGRYGGMSGSPIVTADGSAIGVYVIGEGAGEDESRNGGPHPHLTHHLPSWLLQELKVAVAANLLEALRLAEAELRDPGAAQRDGKDVRAIIGAAIRAAERNHP
jgi:hypothetical protein